MSELNFTKLADAPVLDEVPDGAKVYAEVNGKVYRVAGDNLGGGIPTAIFKLNMDSGDTASVQSLLTGGVATVDAGDNARATDATVYTATCENMTFEEAKSIIENGGFFNAVLFWGESGATGIMPSNCIYYIPGDEATESSEKNATPIAESITIYFAEAGVTWTADGIEVGV